MFVDQEVAVAALKCDGDIVALPGEWIPEVDGVEHWFEYEASFHRWEVGVCHQEGEYQLLCQSLGEGGPQVLSGLQWCQGGQGSA